MPRCVIVGGAPIMDYERVRAYLKKDDFFVFCDCGLAHIEKLDVTPKLIVGDFDSYERPDTDIETIVLPREKDDTDTVYAVKEALKRGYDDFLLIGVIGGRLDHTLGNVSILSMLYSANKHGEILDDYSIMQVVGDEFVSVEEKYPYFSIINLFGKADGIEIIDAKYPLTDGSITCDYQYGVSNEVLPGKTAGVRIKQGRALLVKVFTA